MEKITTSFSFLQNIDISAPFQAEKQIDDARGACISYEDILTKKIHHGSLEEMSEKLANGRFSVDINSSRFECVFNYKQSRNLYVIYSGARESGTPSFPRWSYYPLLDGCYLGIDDPMFNDYEDLKLGFYYGTRERSYISDSLLIVMSICSKLNIPQENIIFFGSSGGGYAALYASTLINKSLSISINPQLYIQNYKYSKEFTRITAIDLYENDILNRNNLINQVIDSKAKHVIICNIKDAHHFKEQLIPFCSQFKLSLRYPISTKDNLLVWLYDAIGAPSAHTSYETKSIFSIIDYIAKCFNLDGGIPNSVINLATITNCFWNELYILKKKLTSSRSSQLFIIEESTNLEKTYSAMYNISKQAKDSKYNNFRININSNSINSIKIQREKILCSSQKISLVIFDFKERRNVYRKDYNINDDIKLNFIVGANNSLSVCIYAGLQGATQGHSLEIKECQHLSRFINVD